MNIATERPLPRGEFEARLVGAAEAYPYPNSRFFRSLASGRCPRPVLRRYAASCCVSAGALFSTFARLIAVAPDPEAKLLILQNLMEEQGIHLSESGLLMRPARAHDSLARRFFAACGGTAEDIAKGTHATGPGRQLVAEGRWLEGISYLLIGQERGFSEASRLMLGVLPQYGFSARDLAFFAVHVEADCAHGQQAVGMVVDRADTRPEQEACIAAAEAGARHWFEMHGGEVLERRAA
jgi:pyrroloquinoline quinone (PQQ) biosynthesis protein C